MSRATEMVNEHHGKMVPVMEAHLTRLTRLTHVLGKLVERNTVLGKAIYQMIQEPSHDHLQGIAAANVLQAISTDELLEASQDYINTTGDIIELTRDALVIVAVAISE